MRTLLSISFAILFSFSLNSAKGQPYQISVSPGVVQAGRPLIAGEDDSSVFIVSVYYNRCIINAIHKTSLKATKRHEYKLPGENAKDYRVYKSISIKNRIYFVHGFRDSKSGDYEAWLISAGIDSMAPLMVKLGASRGKKQPDAAYHLIASPDTSRLLLVTEDFYYENRTRTWSVHDPNAGKTIDFRIFDPAGLSVIAEEKFELKAHPFNVFSTGWALTDSGEVCLNLIELAGNNTTNKTYIFRKENDYEPDEAVELSLPDPTLSPAVTKMVLDGDKLLLAGFSCTTPDHTRLQGVYYAKINIADETIKLTTYEPLHDSVKAFIHSTTVMVMGYTEIKGVVNYRPVNAVLTKNKYLIVSFEERSAIQSAKTNNVTYYTESTTLFSFNQNGKFKGVARIPTYQKSTYGWEGHSHFILEDRLSGKIAVCYLDNSSNLKGKNFARDKFAYATTPGGAHYSCVELDEELKWISRSTLMTSSMTRGYMIWPESAFRMHGHNYFVATYGNYYSLMRMTTASAPETVKE